MTDPADSELSHFRQQIDAIDDNLISLLIERTGIVSRVGEMKRRTNPGKCPIRPGREAEMLRDIMKKFEGEAFLPAAAAAIWRLIIGMSTAIEAPLGLSVYFAEQNNDLFWLAREYFGPFANITRQPHVKRVIGDVMDGKAAVGIVPVLRGADTTYWWTNLMQQGNDAPKIFAALPFVHSETPRENTSTALAIARLTPEDSGDDYSVIVIEADHNVSQSRLQTFFSAAKMEASWIDIATLSPQVRHHLLRLKGFITPEHETMQSLRLSLGASILNVSFLGAYAAPIILNNTSANASPHASGTSK